MIDILADDSVPLLQINTPSVVKVTTDFPMQPPSVPGAHYYIHGRLREPLELQLSQIFNQWGVVCGLNTIFVQMTDISYDTITRSQIQHLADMGWNYVMQIAPGVECVGIWGDTVITPNDTRTKLLHSMVSFYAFHPKHYLLEQYLPSMMQYTATYDIILHQIIARLTEYKARNYIAEVSVDRKNQVLSYIDIVTDHNKPENSIAMKIYRSDHKPDTIAMAPNNRYTRDLVSTWEFLWPECAE